MTHPETDPVDDAKLVAWLDEELPPAEAEAVAVAVGRAPQLAQRVALLRAAQHELAGFLRSEDEVAAAAPPSPLAFPRARAAHPRLAPWLMAAGLAVVIGVAFATRFAAEPVVATPAENQYLRVHAVATRGSFPLFGAIAFHLEGQRLSDVPVRIVTRRGAESDDALAARLFAEPRERHGVPLVLDAEVTGPDGARYSGTVRRATGSFAAEPTKIDVALEDLVVGYGGPTHGAINPLLGMRETAAGWVEDWRHQFQTLGDLDVGGRHGFAPELPGAWRIDFTLRSFTAATDSRWITFPEPLRFGCAFQIAGEVGAWSEPVDGLRARLVVSATSIRTGEPLALALQLENRSDRPRSYNITGATMARIPQPYHMTLLENDIDCVQREDLGVITSAIGSYLPQPVGTRRSIAVLSTFWRAAAAPVLSLAGEHQLAIRFHFEPTAWTSEDRSLWMGKVVTPPVTIRVTAPR